MKSTVKSEKSKNPVFLQNFWRKILLQEKESLKEKKSTHFLDKKNVKETYKKIKKDKKFFEKTLESYL